ncbi:DUF1592 domain-containing protein [Verrucomicrobia bacterium]|nr:DUF1592 domain-containing protein [Verrucomicrobiota bacterium]
MRRILTIPILVAALVLLHPDRLQANENVVVPFLGKYCVDCHDSDVQKDDRNFEGFQLPLKTRQDLIDARAIVDQLLLGEMPPKKEDQPDEAERLAMIQALRGGITATRGKLGSEAGGQTIMRRLSNREYENTLEALFGRDLATLGLTADFPKENTSEHMDNIGETLVTSGFLLDQYFQAANRLIELRIGRPDTPAKTWHFNSNFRQPEELSGSHKKAFNYRHLCIYEQPDTDTRQGGYGYIHDFVEGVPVSGLYDIEVLVQAMHRDTHYDPKIFGIDFSEPFQMAVIPGDYRKGHIHYPQKIEPILGHTIAPDDQPEWRKFRVWLEKGQTPRFIFPNGPYESRASVLAVSKRYKDEFKNAPAKVSVGRTHLLLEGKLPHLRISEIKIHGPISEPHGGKEEVSVFGKGGFQVDHALDQLDSFGARAFRRPLTDADRQRIKKTYRKRIAEKATPRQAALDTVKMLLCSPSFLYLAEATQENEPRLGGYDLASRLSYALWTAPPDEALLEAAASGALTDSAELKRQTLRMLGDKRSAGFVNAFLDSWLVLREIGNQPPPRKTARSYYAENLPASMKEEARQMFRHLLQQDGPVMDFLNADYTFVDKKLAKLYQLPEQEKMKLADGFQRVSLVGNRKRGGVLGMAGVLTVSANGVDTSPVTRGVWVMENILGISPAPPPVDVPEIEPDVRGATTLRERLAKHAADKSCRVCHRRIDPLGFALENFGPIGQWRADYPGDKPRRKIDPTGEFSSGDSYANFAEFRQFLAENFKDVFTRSLIEKLLTYSTGRHIEPGDYAEIESILKKVTEENDGLRTMVTEVTGSRVFRSR